MKSLTLLNTLIAGLVLAIAASAAGAGVPDKPVYWAHGGFSGHDQAVETITIRARLSGGHDTFIRFSVANAGYKKGALNIKFRQESAGGTLYASQTWKRGQFKATANRFGFVAGANSLSVDQGKLVVRLAFGTVRATATLTPRAGPLAVRDVDGRAWIRRSLLVPYGTLHVQATDTVGHKVDASGTAFAMHEASKIKAHRTWDRSVQLHHIRGNQLTLVDYIVGPSERKRRVLGFVVLRGGGLNHVGRVVAEDRSHQRLDKRNDYKVPWKIRVDSERQGRKATVEFAAAAQVSRKDDLAKLGYFTRKAVSMLIHPYTYGMKGSVQATIHDKSALARTTKARWKYAQSR